VLFTDENSAHLLQLYNID